MRAMRIMRDRSTMRTITNPILPLVLLLPVLLLSCGTEQKPSATAGDFYPLAVGDTWTYQEDDGTNITEYQYVVTEKINKDFEHDSVGELPVFVMRTTFPSGGGDSDTSGGWRDEYIYDDGTRAVRKRHEIYDDSETLTKTRDYEPGFLRFDRSKVYGDPSWAEEYHRYSDKIDGSPVTEDVSSYLYEIMAPESVTVPVGTFDNCVVVKRTSTFGSSSEIKLYYFAKGVGKVKEVTGGKVEQLVEYSVAGTADGGV
jgi:hypothetical protein